MLTFFKLAGYKSFNPTLDSIKSKMKYSNADEGDYPPSKYKVDQSKLSVYAFSKFIDFIRNDSKESEIDKFLRENVGLLGLSSDFFHTGHHGTWIIPQAYIKPPGINGHGMIPDYLFAGDNSDGVTWWVVEMKSPSDTLFKIDSSGKAIHTSKLKKALAQLNGYISYASEQQDYIRQALAVTSFKAPHGVIIMGREKELYEDKRKQEAKAKFNQKNINLNIRTYDSFLRRIKEFSIVTHKMSFLSKIYLKFFIKEEKSYWDWKKDS